MNHYDDLQRFKDKTRNQKYEFKDLSAQNLAPDHGSWAIMNQLSPASEETKLAMGGHVSLPQPQAVSPDIFARDESHVSYESSVSVETRAENVLPPVSAELPLPAAATPSIFRDVAGQLAAQSATPVVPPARKASVPVLPTATTSASSASSAAVPADYSRLFAPKAAEAKPTVEKNQPLQSLLERIASCR
jgi:hypothetical protein